VEKGFAGFLSEFGSIPYTQIAADYMRSMLVELDRTLISWTFWEISLLQGAPQFIRNSLMRSYPQKVPGRLLQYRTTNTTLNHVANTTIFEVEYVLSAKLNSNSTPTADLFLDPQAFPGSSGYTVQAFPPCCVFVSSQPDPISNVVTIHHDMTKLPPQSVVSIKFTSN
jgi:hypothetical protein